MSPPGDVAALDAAALRAALPAAGRRWAAVEVVAKTGSTNADLAAAARAGQAQPGQVLVAELQTAGRGRLGRGWASPPRAGLTVSVVVAPAGVPADRWTWLPLLTGLAVVEAVEGLTEASVRPLLKWPNDVLVGDRKLAGILVERVGGLAVLGCGLNVSASAADLPPAATSLLFEGARVDRSQLLLRVLAALDGRLSSWESGGDAAQDALRAAYRGRCATLGRRVRVALPDGGQVGGTATDVDGQGRLVVVEGTGRRLALGAGDVVHVR